MPCEIQVGGPINNYQYYRGRGRCVKCHKQDAYTLNGRSYCAECADKDAYRHRLNYDKEKNRDVCYKFRELAKENGLCTNCRRPAQPGKVRCTECLNKQRKATAAYREKKKKVNRPRGDNGYCWICNKKKSDEGYKTCFDCRERLIENLARGRELSDCNRRDHPWRKSNDIFYQKKKK